MRYARVILDFPAIKFFDYRIPSHLDSAVNPGVFVLVPVANRITTGLVYELTKQTSYSPDKIKDVKEVFKEYQFIDKTSLKIIRWISDYYICGYGEAARLLYPNGIAIKSYLWLEMNPNALQLNSPGGKRQNQILEVLKNKPTTYSDLLKKLNSKNLYSTLNTLEKQGYIVTHRKIHQPKVQPKYEILIKLSCSTDVKLTTKQEKIVDLLKNGVMTRVDILNLTGFSSSVIDSLIKKDIVSKEKQQVWRGYSNQYQLPDSIIRLNPSQKTAISAIVSAFDKEIFSIFLLFGVTGSGKTQVYIEAMKHVLTKGKGVICLIPEISLTPQTVARLHLNFGNKVAVLHSRLGEGERFDMWRRVGNGEINIVVGARSALYAPVKNPGLIIIDEEHEHTYKQNESRPLYHARSVATMRAREYSIPLVLGSATPSIESFYNSQIGKYELLKLPNRALKEMQMPNINIIDLRKTRNMGKYDSILSELLLEKIETRLYAGEQVLLLQNRRGYSAFLECTACGHVVLCDHCAVSMSYHIKDDVLRCHFCGSTKSVSNKCSKCDADKIDKRGVGTQQVEELLRQRFPDASIQRMDYDTTSGKSGHEKILSRYASGEIDILVGTQMIAKGLDFPNVTLVGVILADVGIFLPDFRSSERTFHLLTQVSGRSGRGKIPGEVVIQTYNPDHPIIEFVKNQDYMGFYTKEIRDREALGYPPFKWMALIRIESPEENICLGVLKNIMEILAKEFDTRHIDFLGPAPCAFSKIKDQFRWQIILKVNLELDSKANKTRNMLRTLFHNKNSFLPDQVRMVIDIDPHWVL